MQKEKDRSFRMLNIAERLFRFTDALAVFPC